MATPMDSKLKLLANDSSELVDVTQYRHIIGSLNVSNKYQTRHFAMNTLSQYLVQPRCVHQIVAKHVMRYMKGTIDFGYTMMETMTTNCMAIQMQIGMEVSQTGKAHQVDAFVWGLL